MSTTIHTITIRGGLTKTGEREPVQELAIRCGDVVALVGPTGSGKSLLLSDIEQMAEADTPSGRTVAIEGNGDQADRKALVAQLSQTMNFVLDMHVGEFLQLHASSQGLTDTTVVPRVVALTNRLAGEPVALGTNMTMLSGGQSRALMIASIAIISDAPVVLIDEIENAGIDKLQALDLLSAQGKIIVFASHDPLIILRADRRIVMRNGGMAQIVTHQLAIIRNRDAMIASGHYQCLSGLLPDMRPDVRRLGFADPTGYFQIVCIVPIVLVHGRSVENPPTAWSDLLDERWKGRIGGSSLDVFRTLIRFYAHSLFGGEAERFLANLVLDGIPIDTNLHVDKGEVDVGVMPLPFAQGGRNKNIVVHWPSDGALSIPQVVIHKRGSFEGTRHISEYLLSDEVQRYMSETGNVIPVNPNVPLPPLVQANDLNLYWKGWAWFLEGLKPLYDETE